MDLNYWKYTQKRLKILLTKITLVWSKLIKVKTNKNTQNNNYTNNKLIKMTEKILKQTKISIKIYIKPI